ncbi:MAG: NADPH:quinone reductase-like Zn-dependent oxidoreductase [Dinoroseobacter sp.]|jgi:NADPH:quinone reductase-like Zn-dependent oxidoreductase
MKAAIVPTYGPANVIRIVEHPKPVPKAGEILVQIHASTVTTGDWRLRAAAFPKGLKLVGRLVSGLFRPRNAVPGVTFSGIITQIGADVTRFVVGDAVFGSANARGHAEFITVTETSAVALKPAQISHAQGAALPFGAATAQYFLETLGKVQPGERVLITGASGGVGHLGVQVAKALGAHVTALSSARNAAFLEDLGADVVLGYEDTDINTQGRVYDAVFDTIGLLDFAKARKILTKGGRYLTIEGGWRELRQMMAPWRARGHAIRFGVSAPDDAQLDLLANMAEQGKISPVIEQAFAFSDIVEAHRAVETRHRSGVIALVMQAGEKRQIAA